MIHTITVVNLLNVLQKERVTTETDQVSWEGAASSNFSVCNAFKLSTPSVVSSFPVKAVWVPRVPTKAIFFFFHGKLLGERS